MSVFRTTYELNVGETKIARWTENDRKSPPPKKFILIPRAILSRSELTDYASRAAVVSSTPGNGGYLVQVEAIRL